MQIPDIVMKGFWLHNLFPFISTQYLDKTVISSFDQSFLALMQVIINFFLLIHDSL